MKNEGHFAGFSPEALDFMWGIRLNNNKPWFDEHKNDYVNYLYEPMKALGAQLFAPYQDIPGMRLKVSRIYRDMRMHPPEPYRDGLWLSIEPQNNDWARNAGFWFDIHPEGAAFGLGLWQPGAATMERFRRDLIARPDCFLPLVQAAEAKSGLRFTADTYKRPKPCPVPELEPWFAWKCNLGVSASVPPGEELFAPELADRVAEFIATWYPVGQYLWQLTSADTEA